MATVVAATTRCQRCDRPFVSGPASFGQWQCRRHPGGIDASTGSTGSTGRYRCCQAHPDHPGCTPCDHTGAGALDPTAGPVVLRADLLPAGTPTGPGVTPFNDGGTEVWLAALADPTFYAALAAGRVVLSATAAETLLAFVAARVRLRLLTMITTDDVLAVDTGRHFWDALEAMPRDAPIATLRPLLGTIPAVAEWIGGPTWLAERFDRPRLVTALAASSPDGRLPVIPHVRVQPAALAPCAGIVARIARDHVEAAEADRRDEAARAWRWSQYGQYQRRQTWLG